jgi:hypothetical protein
MNNKNRMILTCFAFLMGVFCGNAAPLPETSVPLPPYVVNAPASSSWTVTFKPKVASTPAQPPATNGTAVDQATVRTETKIQTTKHNQVRRMIITWSDGAVTEKWWIEDCYLYEVPGSPGVRMLLTKGVDPIIFALMEDYSQTDFPEFSWISVDNFLKTLPYGGKACHSFRIAPDPVSTPSESPKAPGSTTSKQDGVYIQAPQVKSRKSTGIMQAWIDSTTHLPVALDNGISLQTYSFDSSSPQELQLPARFAEVLKAYKDATEPPAKYQMKVN